ncbi:hypothetical protein ACJMK2_025323 [Sinanodonta woodiana]|uniref:THAP-type domain-containing protein n=1 Tax=Sinanodonta woodiana TaxID=1069815 RepID=A0ABD3XJX8_SINWO
MFCDCICPIKLYPFPTEMKDPENRNKWISNISRTSPASKKIWTPKPEDIVCNKHFMHGCPTQEKPDPNLLMGHDKIKSKSTRTESILKTSKVQSGTEFDNTENISMCQNLASSSDIHTRRDVEVQTETDMNVISDISVQNEFSVQNCDTCRTKDKLINSLTQKLTKNNQKLCGSVEYRYLQSDKKNQEFMTKLLVMPYMDLFLLMLKSCVTGRERRYHSLFTKGVQLPSVNRGETISECYQQRMNLSLF